MPEALTLARPYARAAFEVAQAANTLDAWSDALAFAASVAANPGVATMRNDPRIESPRLVALHLPASMEGDRKFARLLEQLAEHGRLALLPEIAKLFDTYKRDVEKVLRVKVTSAAELDADQVERLKTALQGRYERAIELDAVVDPTLLGGAIIDAGTEVIDGSARGRLAQLAGALGQ